VGGRGGLKTAKKLRKRIQRLGISCDRIATDDGDSFLSAFAEDNHDTGKKHTIGIEGNNCRIRRAFWRTCCFSGKLRNHWKAFAMTFFTLIMVLFDNPSYFVDHLRRGIWQGGMQQFSFSFQVSFGGDKPASRLIRLKRWI
jgi:IS1 family transposase